MREGSPRVPLPSFFEVASQCTSCCLGHQSGSWRHKHTPKGIGEGNNEPIGEEGGFRHGMAKGGRWLQPNPQRHRDWQWHYSQRVDVPLQVHRSKPLLTVFSSVFQLAIAQHEERMYVEIAKIFEKFVYGQSKVNLFLVTGTQ